MDESRLVRCRTPEEGLLLCLIDRTERLEALVKQLTDPGRHNVLDDFRPEDAQYGITRQQDARNVIKRLREYTRSEGDVTLVCDVCINFSENVERLRRNGFTVTKGQYCYEVRWPLLPRGGGGPLARLFRES